MCLFCFHKPKQEVHAAVLVIRLNNVTSLVIRMDIVISLVINHNIIISFVISLSSPS